MLILISYFNTRKLFYYVLLYYFQWEIIDEIFGNFCIYKFSDQEISEGMT